MKLKKFLFYFLPFVLLVISLGFYYSDRGTTATSVAEALNTTAPIQVVNQQSQLDMVGAWTSGATLSSPRYYTGGVGYSRNDSGWVYVFGGDSTGAGATAAVNMYRYSVNANTWTQMAPLPQGRRLMAATRLQDTIYCVTGIGQTGPASTLTMYKYNVNTNAWSNAANVPDSMWYVRTVGYQDSLIYLVGGYGANLTTRTTVYLYNAKTNSWRTASPLPLGRGDGACALAGDTIVYVGGLNEATAVTNTVYKGVIDQTNRGTIVWTTGTAFPGGNRYRWNAESWGGKGIIVSGGSTTGFTPQTATYTYSPGANTWTLQAACPTALCASGTGMTRTAAGIYKYVMAAGVTTGPALTGVTVVYTDTLAGPPPPPPGNTLVITNDSTTPTTPRIADRDTLKKYVNMLVGNVTYMTKNTTTVFPDLSSYNTIIFQETSFDATTVRSLVAAQRQALKDWLATGTPSSKKSLIMIGGDLGYAYDQAGVAQLDTVFSRSYGGFQYVLDNGAPVANAFVGQVPGTLFDAMSTTPPGTNYWPDGCKPISGGATFNLYKFKTDTIAGVSKTGAGWNVVSTFQDPRYYTGAGDGTGDVGFKRVLKNMIAWVKANNGIITGITPVVNTVAKEYSLSQNYPNPFNPTTKINFSIPTNGFVSLKVYDMAGKEVTTLVSKNMTVGTYNVEFDASYLSSGVYFYRLQSNSFVETKKMILVK